MTKGMDMDAQWALEGKQPDGEGYRILACSTGDLNRANFADALSRFQPGELTTLPQVSVSYARQGTQPGVSYLALAVHDFAAGGRRAAHDRNGRKITYTSYFCVPYKRLADMAIGYLAMYQALRVVTLPETDGPPLPVTLPAPVPRVLAVHPLAMRVAALLLTGKPVCVLGAEATSTGERLSFIDAVMDLLPYGLRARMAAATWTRATHGSHRFRLFFSSAPRSERPDHVVNWGDDPDLVRVPDKTAGEYLDWLQDNAGPLTRLADLSIERGFGPKDTLQVLELAVSRRAALSLAPSAQADSAGTAATQDPGEEALLSCAEHAKLANFARLRTDIVFLRKFAEDEIGEDSRVRYRDLITRLGLLRHGVLAEGKYEERLYDALLPMAFGTPLNYEAYCRLEKCAGISPGDAPHRELLTAIVRAGMADQVVSAIVYWHLRETDEPKLNRWLLSGEVDAVELINLLARDWTYPQHARIFCDVMLEYLKKARGHHQPQQIRAALRRHGFLARTLQLRHPDMDQYQVSVLYQFLRVAYPQSAATPGQGLSRAAVVQVLTGSAHPPTPALFAAVAMLVSKPADVRLVREAYAHGSLTLMNVDDATTSRLKSLMPDITRASFPVPVEEPPEPKSAEPPL